MFGLELNQSRLGEMDRTNRELTALFDVVNVIMPYLVVEFLMSFFLPDERGEIPRFFPKGGIASRFFWFLSAIIVGGFMATQ